jgi:hypothetical protein
MAVRYRFKVAEKPEVNRFPLFFFGLPITVVIKDGAEAKFVKTSSECIPFITLDYRPSQRNQSIPESNYADYD